MVRFTKGLETTLSSIEISMQSSYVVASKSHQDLCSTYKIVAQDYHGVLDSEHPGLELNFTHKFNQQHFRVRSKNLRLDPNSFLLFNSRETHYEIYNGNSEDYAVVFNSGNLKQLLAHTNVNPDEVVFDQIQFQLSQGLKESAELLMQGSRGEETSAFLFDSLVTHLVTCFLMELPHSHSKQIQRQVKLGRFPQTLRRAQDLIYRHLFEEDYSLDHLAAQVGMSKFHLVRSFKKELGVTPGRYRNQLRIDTAKSYLTQTQRSIVSIANSLGYGNLSTFNKSFKQNTNRSPSQFRKEKLS